MTDFDPSAVYELLVRAGLDFDAILAMPATSPARRFGRGGAGTVHAGEPGDLVVYERDPASSPANFGRVSHAIRGGRIETIRFEPCGRVGLLNLDRSERLNAISARMMDEVDAVQRFPTRR